MQKTHIVCSKPECSFSAQDNYRTDYCPRCAEPVLRACPHCEELLWYNNQVACTRCAKPLKAAPVQDQAPA